MKRLTELDVLRGILMLMMVVDHSPSSLRRFTDEPIGFFTTAEAFVFVSAFLAGMLFRKRIEKNGFNAARSSTIRRAGRIYCAHLLTLAFAFVIGSFLLSYLPGLRTLFEQYLKNPPAAIGASMLLVFQPPLMGILPTYILFSFLTPLVFRAAGRWGWKTVIFSSLSIWLIAQLRVRDLLVTATKDLSYINPGPFDVLAWQFLWVGGLFCGQRLCEKKRAVALPNPLPVILILKAAILAAVRRPRDNLSPQVGGNDHSPTRFANSTAPTAAEVVTATQPNQPTPRPRAAPHQSALCLYPACPATPSAVAELPSAVVTSRGHRVLRVRGELLETYRLS